MLVYPSSMTVSTQTLTFVTTTLREHRRQLGTRWRVLSSGRQALMVLAHLRKGETYRDLAVGFGVGVTTLVKREITQVPVTKPCCRRAEISALLRFTDALHVVQGKVAVQARVDAPETAHRVRRQIIEVFAVPADQVVLSPGRPDPQGQYLVQVARGGDTLARRAGLLDRQGRPVRGLPPRMVTGPVCDAEAIWRGAFLAAGTVHATGRTSSLTVTCPGPETALALTGAARRLSIPTRARGEQGTVRVSVSSHDTITELLTRLGAVTTWQEHSTHTRTRVRQNASRQSNFDRANAHRVADAAAAACARVERALQILGDDVPEQLRAVARLRLKHPDASLKDLAQLSLDPWTGWSLTA